MNSICFVGAKFGLGGFDADTNLAPAIILNQQFLASYKKFFLEEDEPLDFINSLAFSIKQIKELNQFPFIIGGDHSVAVGTWRHAEVDSLIWIDGHEDAHTPYTSHSKRLHGMPLAILLGNGKYYFTLGKRILDPLKVTIIGTRSYETEEDALLKHLGVKIIYLKDFNSMSIQDIAEVALQRTCGTNYGISLDIDVLDPQISPGTQCQELDGLNSHQLIKLIECLKTDKLKAVELVEYNPNLDKDNKTLDIINKIINVFI